MMMNSAQRRHYSRIRFSSGARLLVGDHEYRCEVLDLSLKGALLAFDGERPTIAADEPCLLEIGLDDGLTVIRMQGVQAHVEGPHLGLACREIDLDSITHLRRLLTLNLGDAESLSRELSALIAKPVP